MRKLFFTLFIAIYAVMAVNAQGIKGKWKTSMEGPDGSMEITFIFKVEGDSLTGSVILPIGEMEIKNGKVKGNEFSFNIDMNGNAIPHKGKLEGDVIKMNVEMPGGGQGGPGGPGGPEGQEKPEGVEDAGQGAPPRGPGEMTLTKVVE
jgi:hypothetical protein